MFIITPCQCISPEVNVISFKKCCIPSGVDGNEGDMLWNDCDEGGDVRNEWEEDEGTDFEDLNSDNDW
jgi:hypothetical protein